MSVIYRNLLSPAKVNLILRVGGPRSDGFHPIETLIHKVNWGDTLDLKVGRAKSLDISLVSNLKLRSSENLAYRAAQAFSDHFGLKFRIEMKLKKRIPTGAGLGGGSSNAALVLNVLARFYELSKRYQADLESIGARLGSDVPMFMREGALWCEGRGEILYPVSLVPLNMVLVFPATQVPTPWAYRLLDLSRKGQKIKLPGRPAWIEQKNLCVPELVNDFEAPIFREKPLIEVAKRDLAKKGALAGLMSGSGSTVFGIFSDQIAAVRAARALRKEGWSCTACQSLYKSK